MSNRRRRVLTWAVIMVTGVLAVITVALSVDTSGYPWGAPERKQTPCEAALQVTHRVDELDPALVSRLEGSGDASFSMLLRGLVTGGYQDIKGATSPELAKHLLLIADALQAYELEPVETRRLLREVWAYCATHER